MADKLVEPLVSFSVQTLLNLLVEEAKFLNAVSGEVDVMQTELTRMRKFLIDADKRMGEDARVSNLVVEIRELAYDAEEVIATFVVQVAGAPPEASHNDGGTRHPPPACFNFKRCFRVVKTSPRRHAVGTQIQEINSKIVGLRKSLKTYGVQSTVVPTKPRITYSLVVEEIVVGLQDHVSAVAEHLMDVTHARIISICGTGGLGKTTFSKEIHHHKEINDYFDHVAWACVSQQCNPNQVLRDILLQFVHQPGEKSEIRAMTLNELVLRLHWLQTQKKYLVILDDIWQEEDWNNLSPAFPTTTQTGSKIVLTTRNQVVVSHSDIRCTPYNLPLLSYEDCLELVKMKVSAQEQGFRISTEMTKVMEEIVGHCGGLPLAVVVAAGVLARDRTLNGWEKVRDDLNTCLKKGNDRHGGVWEVLALSYQELPYHLKACFFYLGIFPENHDIEAKSVVQMLISEGFVSGVAIGGEGTKSMLLDIGLSYLDELVNRSMVEAVITKLSGRVKSCRVHDLMRQFCRTKAQEEQFSENRGLQKVRRLAVHLKDEDELQQQMSTSESRGKKHDYQHVRSCLVHQPDADDNVMKKCWDEVNALLNSFNFLKVFKLVGLPHDGQLSEDIGRLIHLRFLSIGHRLCTSMIKIPSSLGNLILLQTLNLRDLVGITVPNVLWKLKELRHLYLPYWYCCTAQLRLDGLSKLETLINFSTSSSSVGDLATLPNLRKILIQCNIKDLAQIFEHPMFRKSNSLLRRSTFNIDGAAETQEEHSLLSQVLACSRVLKFRLHGLVREETFLHNLNATITLIELRGCRLQEDPMPALGKMPNLRRLVLAGDSYVGEKMECLTTSVSTGGFPQLTCLWLQGLGISEWKVEEGAMPCLSELLLDSCKNLNEILDGLRFVTTLQLLSVSGPTVSLQQRLQQGGEDFRKIQHVPFLSITDWHT